MGRSPVYILYIYIYIYILLINLVCSVCTGEYLLEASFRLSDDRARSVRKKSEGKCFDSRTDRTNEANMEFII